VASRGQRELKIFSLFDKLILAIVIKACIMFLQFGALWMVALFLIRLYVQNITALVIVEQ